MNIGNSSIKEIGKTLKGANKIALFPHVNMDGDAMGSCVALCHALTALGKKCKIMLSDEIPDNLKFLDREPSFSTFDAEEIKGFDLGILIDCGELKRITGRENDFQSLPKSISLDHHGTTEAFCQMNYIDPNEAATGQIVYKLIKELEIGEEDNIFRDCRKEMANALFAAITTDTGDFQYSNTQKESHEIVSQLFDWGLESNKVSVEIYENNRIERLRLTAEVLSTLELLGDGKVAVAYCSQEMLKRTGAKMEETEWIASDLRGIKGVEVAIFLKEEEEELIKGSLRSKYSYDVAKLASEFGGGGHLRASGYTRNKSLGDALKEIKERIQKDF